MNEGRGVESRIKELSDMISVDVQNTDLLYERAGLYTKIQVLGKAINDYLTILGINPDDKQAKVKLEMLKTITRFSNTDIYANPNTNMDPWLE